MAYFVIIGINH